jgi:uncharacterized protein YbdZ (MbtH family)
MEATMVDEIPRVLSDEEVFELLRAAERQYSVYLDAAALPLGSDVQVTETARTWDYPLTVSIRL